MNDARAPQPKPVPPVAVLGMHRSGTSCLTGLLKDAGVWLGPVSRRARYNLKGNRENPDIVALHDGVLADNGASWHHPPGRACRWSRSHTSALGRILESYPRDRVWAFKDPRACFTIGAWKRAVPELRFIGTYRHPLAVAASLHHRNGFPVERGIDLWLGYNRLLVALQREFGFRLVCFDLDPDAYLAQVASCLRGLGLEFSPAALSFFDADLRTRTPGYAALHSSEALDLYGYLRRLSG